MEPDSKRSSYQTAQKFLEPPSYELHDVYRALSVLADECDLIQSEAYKNSHFVTKRNDRILYYDCTNCYFEIQQEDGNKKYGKSKEQTSLKPFEKKVLQEFGCEKFIYCSDAGLGSENNRKFNHMGEWAFIVTQSIKKLPKEEREWALKRTGFRRISDGKITDIANLYVDDEKCLFYKEEPYTTKNSING